MFLTCMCFQTCLRHPECHSARQNRNGLFVQMKQALHLIHNVATDTGYQALTNGSLSPTMVNGDSGIVLGVLGISAHKAMKDFEVIININSYSANINKYVLLQQSLSQYHLYVYK